MFQDNRRIKLVTLGTMCFTLFMIMLDSTVVNLALKTIQDKLAASLSELQWIVDAYVLFIASLLLTGGTLGDMFGRRKAFMGGLGLFALGSMACALSPSIDWLIAARCLQGIGAAVMMPSTLSILTNTFPDPKERAQAIGMWAGVSGLALAVGPLIGGVMVQHLGWQSIFWINVPVGALALVCAALFVPESSARDGRSLDTPGQLLAITGLASLTYALIEANSYGWTSPRILACFAVATVALTGFFAVETRSRTPMLDLSFFRNSTFAGANLTGLIVSFAFFGIVFFLSLFFQRVQGYSPTEAGLLALPMTITVMITAVASGRIVGRIGSRLPMTIGMVITGLGLLSLTTVQYDTPYSHIWFLLIPIGLGNGLVMSPMTTAAMSTVPGRRAGMASATLNTVRQVGSVFGIAVLGNIVTRSFVDYIPSALAGLHLPAPAVAAIKVAAKQGQESAPAKAPPGIDLTAVSNAVSNAFTQAFHTGLWVSGLLLLAGAPLAFAMIRMKSPHEASKKARAKAREAAAGEAEAAAVSPAAAASVEAAVPLEATRPVVHE
jgi:EmrB/QacA subfamily drug resistance transporter